MRHLLCVLMLAACYPAQAIDCQRFLEQVRSEARLSEDELMELEWSDEISSAGYVQDALEALAETPESAAVEVLRQRLRALKQQLGESRSLYSMIRVPLAVPASCEAAPDAQLEPIVLQLLEHEAITLHEEIERLEQRIEQARLPLPQG